MLYKISAQIESVISAASTSKAIGFSATLPERSTCLARPLNQIVVGQTPEQQPDVALVMAPKRGK